jgi:VIT1/CCC1 family predicted Fe2+/Mn2+ transporter
MAELKMVHHHRDVQGGAARAAVFGISDGLVSNVGLILGVAAAATDGSTVIIAGIAGLLAGAVSMAAGEYVSVKAEAELVERELAIERESLANDPEEETQELASIYISRGIDPEKAYDMANTLMADPEIALEVHAREELGVDPDSVGDPIGAAVSSFGAFTVGAVLPLIPWFFAEGTAAIVASVIIGVVAALGVGATLAHFTERSKPRTALRQACIAAVACAVTWLIGSLVGTVV